MRSRSYFAFGSLLIFLLTTCDRRKDQEEVVAEYDQVSIMTYNVLFSSSNDLTLDVLKQTGADIIGVQEASPMRFVELAQKLHYKFASFPKTSGNLSDQDTGILSRFPITGYFENGVKVRINPSLEVAVFTVHLSPYPYQPYDFRDGVIQTAEQAIAAASAERLPEINPVLTEIAEVAASGIPVFLIGDFNEPSHLDWDSITSPNHFNKIVEWPVSKAIANAGLSDVYRAQFPNPANAPGITWTTIESSDEVYDRIDIIYQTPTSRLTRKDIRLVGGTGDVAGIKVENYPSDHYAVIATYSLK